MGKRRILSLEGRRSLFFKKMFLSYCLIIILSFLAYSSMVCYEAFKVKREQTIQYYDTKIQALATAMDQQIYCAQKIVSDVNTSSLINKLYFTIQMNKPVDSYLLYQVLNDIRFQKTAVDNLNIYDVVLLFNGYDKAYTGGEVIRLPEKARLSSMDGTFIQVSDLNSLLEMKNDGLIFYKKYMIYAGSYKYGLGSGRGLVCILFEKDKLNQLLSEVAGDATGYVMYYNDLPLVQSGSLKGKSFLQVSHFNKGITYEIFADEGQFGFKLTDLSAAALIFGFFIGVCYLLLAYFFASQYSSPFEKIRKLVGGERKERRNEKDKIVDDVAMLLGERNGYMEQVHNISPYASQGMIHSLLLGSGEMESVSQSFLKDFIEWKRMFYLVAVVDISCRNLNLIRKEDVVQLKKGISELAEKESDGELKILVHEKEFLKVYLIFNSDSVERLEDRLYDFFDILKKENSHTNFVLTIGADEVREELNEISASCEDALLALEKILWEGRGSIYFYDSNLEGSMNYYFPRDGVKRLIKAMKEYDREGLLEIFHEIRDKNSQEYDGSVFASQLLLSECYVTVVKVLRSVWEHYSIPVKKVEKCPPYCTIDEVIDYYMGLLKDALDETEISLERKEELQQTDRDLIAYINENDKNPNLSLTQIADHFSVSGKYVTSLVKQQFGVTYLKYVQERRINYAVMLLSSTSLSLEKIAEECGYTNILTFRRNFKAIMEKNPSDYRMKTGGSENETEICNSELDKKM